MHIRIYTFESHTHACNSTQSCTHTRTHTHTYSQGRFSNSIAGFGGAFQHMSEENDDIDRMSIGIHGYGGYGRNMADTTQPSALTNSLQINTTRKEGQVSLRFSNNVGNYQRHQSTRGEGADLTIGSKPRKKAGKLYKPFHTSFGNSNMLPRKEHWQGRQPQGIQMTAARGQRTANTNAAQQMGRRWESSAYNQQEYRNQVSPNYSSWYNYRHMIDRRLTSPRPDALFYSTVQYYWTLVDIIIPTSNNHYLISI